AELRNFAHHLEVFLPRLAERDDDAITRHRRVADATDRHAIVRVGLDALDEVATVGTRGAAYVITGESVPQLDLSGLDRLSISIHDRPRDASGRHRLCRRRSDGQEQAR